MTDREITTFYRGVQKWCAEAGYELYLYEVRSAIELSVEFVFFIRPIGNFNVEQRRGVNFSSSANYLRSGTFNVSKHVAATLVKRYEEEV